MAHLRSSTTSRSALITAALLLRKRGHHVIEADGRRHRSNRLAEEVFASLSPLCACRTSDVLDVLRPPGAGHCPEVILLTPTPNGKCREEAIRLGALDYFEKGQEPTSSIT